MGIPFLLIIVEMFPQLRRQIWLHQSGGLCFDLGEEKIIHFWL